MRDRVDAEHSGGRRRVQRRTWAEGRRHQRNKRGADLRATYRHHLKHGSETREWDVFLADTTRQLGRDPLDCDLVPPAELGRRLNRMTFEKMREIEDEETAYRRGLVWLGPGDQYRIRTILPVDKTPAELSRERGRDRQARKREAERNEKMRARFAEATEDEMTMLRSYPTYAEELAARKAIRQSQADSLLAAIGKGDEMTVADLVTAVRHQPCWRGLAEDTLRRTVSFRLDDLRDRGRILDRYEHGLRLVGRVGRPAPK